jgi:hypothetical protein
MKIQRSHIEAAAAAQQALQEINERTCRNRSPALHHIQTNSKGFGNINLSVDEAGDIFCGWSNDGLIRFQKQILRRLTDAANFKPLITKRNLINKNYENKYFITAISNIKRIYSANH